jgi:hypothetical protein
MDDKTEELRDIFLSVSEEETVTESQDDDRGSLAEESGSVERRLAGTIDRIREKFGFETDLSDEQRRLVLEGFYDGASDAELAESLGTDTETVFRARMDLHLVRDAEPELDDAAVRTVRDRPDASAAELAETVGSTADEIRRCRAVLEVQDRSRRVSQRFRTTFEEILTDVELTGGLTADPHEDGLDEATEGAETEVDL